MGVVAPSSHRRPSLKIVGKKAHDCPDRSPADILQEVALRAPEVLKACLTLCRAALRRLPPAS